MEQIERVAVVLRRPDPADRADRRGQVAARAPHLRAETEPASGVGRLRRAQLRDPARRRRDVGALRARPRRLHRRASRSAGAAARRRQRHAVPRRGRRAGADEQAMLLRALEEKLFLPLGADREVRSDFQLVAGTNRDLEPRRGRRALPRRPARAHQPLVVRAAGAGGAARRCRAEYRLRARTLRAPAPDDSVRFNLQARAAYPRALPRRRRRAGPAIFAISTRRSRGWRPWPRAAASPRRGRRRDREVDSRRGGGRRCATRPPRRTTTRRLARVLGPERAAALDLFDRAQLVEVLRTCASSPSLSEAGRSSSARHGRREPPPTTPTGCANTLHGLASIPACSGDGPHRAAS